MEDRTAVEAALFAATGPLTVRDIAARTELSEEDARKALNDLKKEYASRESAIVISQVGSKYRMLLRADCVGFTEVFAKPEMSGGTMRTLSTVAYNQPVLQSRLVKVRGPRAYADVEELVKLGYVSAKPKGQTLELTTTHEFAQHFGIRSARKSDVKKWIEQMSRDAGKDDERSFPA